MENLAGLIYWADILPRFIVLFSVVAFFAAAAAFCTAFVMFEDKGEFKWSERRPYAITLTVIALITGSVAMFIPKQETMYMMAGVKVIPEIVETTPELEKVREIINRKLDSMLSEEENQ